MKVEFTKEELESLFQIGILRMVQELHMSFTGASDGLSPSLQKKYVDYLDYRVKNWSDSGYIVYDQLVKALILLVIREYGERV